MEIVVRNRQNIFDIALQYFGSLDFMSTIIIDNNLTWNANLETGQRLLINNEGLGRQDIKNFFVLNNLQVVNGVAVKSDPNNPTFDSEIVTWDNDTINFDSL